MTVTGFLCTRVTVAAVEDQEKLCHLLGNIKGTSGKKLNIQPQEVLQVEAYIDTAFDLNPDSKFHSVIAFYWKKIGLCCINKAKQYDQEPCRK